MNWMILKSNIITKGSAIVAGFTITKNLTIENYIYYNSKILKGY